MDTKCKHCGEESNFTVEKKGNTFHLYCGSCAKYIKPIKKADIPKYLPEGATIYQPPSDEPHLPESVEETDGCEHCHHNTIIIPKAYTGEQLTEYETINNPEYCFACGRKRG